MGRTPEKRAVSVAMVNVLGRVGNIIAPYFFVGSDEPRYRLQTCQQASRLQALACHGLVAASRAKPSRAAKF